MNIQEIKIDIARILLLSSDTKNIMLNLQRNLYLNFAGQRLDLSVKENEILSILDFIANTKTLGSSESLGIENVKVKEFTERFLEVSAKISELVLAKLVTNRALASAFRDCQN